MSRSRFLATLWLGGLLLLAAAAANASTLICESKNNSYQTCPVDASGGVHLSRQLSSQGCWQNDTWGFDRNRAGKKHDDRRNKSNNNQNNNSYDDRYDDNHRGGNYDGGRYGYNGYGGDPRRTFRCESRDDRRQYCSIPTRGHVEVHKQRSSRPCTYGRSWGVNGDRVWVDDGCRAEFAVF